MDRNEVVYELAKVGAETSFTGPEPFCGIPDCYIKSVTNFWEAKM